MKLFTLEALGLNIFLMRIEIASASFAFFFSLTTRIIKKLLSLIRNKKKKHGKTLILAKCKLNIIENLVSKELIEMEISHKELITILIENNK